MVFSLISRIGWLFLVGGGSPLPYSETFQGFSPEGLKPVYELFRADPEGRLLLRNSWKKMGFDGSDDLTRILCFCEESEVSGHPDRRGVFSQERARFYREKGETEWRQLTLGGKEKLEDPNRFPVAERRESTSLNFEHLEVAFLPRICVRKGLTVLQTYLVLVHELTHLTGMDPFYRPDLLGFSLNDMEREFYFRELQKPGGELEAFVAQTGAFQRVKDRYPVPFESVLESFLKSNGRMLYRQKTAFLQHLLDDANYRAELDKYLRNQIVDQYNFAYGWWDYFEQSLGLLDEHLKRIDRNLGEARLAESKAEEIEDEFALDHYSSSRKELERQRLLNRRKYRRLLAEQRKHAAFMTELDRRFPANNRE